MRAAGSSKTEIKKFRKLCESAATAAFVGVSLNLEQFAEAQCALCNPDMCRAIGEHGRASSCCPPDPRCPSGPIEE